MNANPDPFAEAVADHEDQKKHFSKNMGMSDDEAACPEAHLFDRAVDNQVSRLRRKIEADNRDPHFIQTVRGGGYRFGADVTRLAAKSA